MISLITAYDTDDENDASSGKSSGVEESPQASRSPRAPAPPTPAPPPQSTSTSTVQSTGRKTLRPSTSHPLFQHYLDSDEDEAALDHFRAGVIDIVASPKNAKFTPKSASTLRSMRLLPPEPLGAPDPVIQEKISKFLKMGQSYNSSLQGLKNFHNPYILNKIAEKYGINQTSTNYPPDIYDPHEWEKEDYERIARRQEHQMKEKAQQQQQPALPLAPEEHKAPPPLLPSNSSSNLPVMRRWDSQPPNKKLKPGGQAAQMQHALQVANQLMASLSGGAIDAAAAAKKEARAATAPKKS